MDDLKLSAKGNVYCKLPECFMLLRLIKAGVEFCAWIGSRQRYLYRNAMNNDNNRLYREKKKQC